MSSRSFFARLAIGAVLFVVALGIYIQNSRPGKSSAGALPVARPAPPPADARAVRDLASRGAPLSVQRRALHRYLVRRGISRASIAAVFRHTRDGIALRPGPGPGSASTRLGGRAVLPVGVSWPVSSTGTGFTFVALLDFAELPALDPLPAGGRLALYWNFNWYDEAGKLDYVAATRAYYLPPGAPSASPAPPDSTYAIAEKPKHGVLMPFAGEAGRVVDEIEGRPDKDKLIDAMNHLADTGLYAPHVLGASLEIQGPVLDEIPSYFAPGSDELSAQSRAKFTPAEYRDPDKWLLLAQIEEEDDLVIADGGVLYFVMLKADLGKRRFDRVIGIMQSH